MVIIGLSVGFIMIHIGVWRYYHCGSGAGKIISVCTIIAGILIIVEVFVVDAINYKGNPYQESLGKYYSEECQPLVLSGGSTDGEINILKCNKTILQVDAAEYDNAIRNYNKSAGNQQGGGSD